MTLLDFIAFVDEWAIPTAVAGLALAGAGLLGIYQPWNRGAE